MPSDILFYLGRTLTIAPSAALSVPANDPVAIVRPTGTTQAFVLASNVLNVAPNAVAPANLDAVQCSPLTQTIVQITNASFLPLAPILANAGYFPASPLPLPATSLATPTWARLANTSGLVAGVTKLGDELTLLYRQDQIVNSVFASMLGWTWNGTAFAA